MGHEVLLTLTRGNLEESHHLGAYCVVADGRIERSRGDIEVPVFFRSAAKPIQALTVVESGAPDRFGFTEEELALVVASHSGSPRHAQTAHSMLKKAGESPTLLRCGGHTPLGRGVHEDYVRSGYLPGRLEDNCSGKHAGMISAAKALGADPASYADLEHPVQQTNLDNVALLTGIDRDRIVVGVDGCAVPSFGVPVRAMAAAAATFGSPDELPAGKAAAARRLADAMVRHPLMVGGVGRFDTKLIEAGKGRLIAKSGAEGVEIVALRGEHLGIAVKIADGTRRAVHAVVCALLIDLGILDKDDVTIFYPRDVLTREGKPVGVYKVRL